MPRASDQWEEDHPEYNYNEDTGMYEADRNYDYSNDNDDDDDYYDVGQWDDDLPTSSPDNVTEPVYNNGGGSSGGGSNRSEIDYGDDDSGGGSGSDQEYITVKKGKTVVVNEEGETVRSKFQPEEMSQVRAFLEERNRNIRRSGSEKRRIKYLNKVLENPTDYTNKAYNAAALAAINLKAKRGEPISDLRPVLESAVQKKALKKQQTKQAKQVVDKNKVIQLTGTSTIKKEYKDITQTSSPINSKEGTMSIKPPITINYKIDVPYNKKNKELFLKEEKRKPSEVRAATKGEAFSLSEVGQYTEGFKAAWNWEANPDETSSFSSAGYGVGLYTQVMGGVLFSAVGEAIGKLISKSPKLAYATSKVMKAASKPAVSGVIKGVTTTVIAGSAAYKVVSDPQDTEGFVRSGYKAARTGLYGVNLFEGISTGIEANYESFKTNVNKVETKKFNKKLAKMDSKQEKGAGFDLTQSEYSQRTLRGRGISDEKVNWLNTELGQNTLRQARINMPGYETAQQRLYTDKLIGSSGHGVFVYNKPYSQVGGVPFYTEPSRVVNVPISRYLSGQSLQVKILSKQTSLSAFRSASYKKVDIPFKPRISKGLSSSVEKSSSSVSSSGDSVITVSGSEFQRAWEKTVGKVISSTESSYVPSTRWVTSYTHSAGTDPYYLKLANPDVVTKDVSGFGLSGLFMSKKKESVSSKGNVNVVSREKVVSVEDSKVSVDRKFNVIKTPRESTGFKQPFKTSTSSKPISRSTSKVSQITKPKPRPQPIINPVITPKPRTRTTTSVVNTPVFTPAQITTPILFPSFKKKKKKPRVFGGFDVFVRRKGEFRKANVKPLRRGEAVSFGASRVKSTAAATFFIKRGFGSLGSFSRKVSMEGIERKTDKKSGKKVWMQKLGSRIGSAGEKREITLEGIKAIKKKSSNKNKLFGGLTKNVF